MLSKLKKWAQSDQSPGPIYRLFFQRDRLRKRARLKALLDTGKPLMSQLSAKKKAYWQPRIDTVLQAPDNADIPHHPRAGELSHDNFVMHNGLEIDPLSYYSYPLLEMLKLNKGVHEPQEEKIFGKVIASLPTDKQLTMLELGAYWAFYSMWFLQNFPDANCLMVEPERQNLEYGRHNFRRNDYKGTFIHGGIGKSVVPQHRITTVDEIVAQNKLSFIDILHSDIQGYELEMLQGAEKTLTDGKVGYAFISTHSNPLHYDCQQLLSDQYGFQLVASADLDESYSWDGILVMKAPDYPGLNTVDIAKRNTNESTGPLSKPGA